MTAKYTLELCAAHVILLSGGFASKFPRRDYPLLLAALYWIADHGDTGAEGRPAYHDMRDYARAAIKRAGGGR